MALLGVADFNGHPHCLTHIAIINHATDQTESGTAFPGSAQGSNRQPIRNPLPIARQPIAEPTGVATNDRDRQRVDGSGSRAQSLAFVAVVAAAANSTKIPHDATRTRQEVIAAVSSRSIANH